MPESATRTTEIGQAVGYITGIHGPVVVIACDTLPPFQDIASKTPVFAQPPELTMPPRQLMSEVTEQYLFAALHQILYTSLAAENHARIDHLEHAIKHLDEESEALARHCNILRQEEIIEEIEVILLSTASTDDWQTNLK